MYSEFIRGPRGVSLHRVVTVFGKKEFATIRLYCKRNRLSLYALAKAAIREYVQRHPWSQGVARRGRRSHPARRVVVGRGRVASGAPRGGPGTNYI